MTDSADKVKAKSARKAPPTERELLILALRWVASWPYGTAVKKKRRLSNQ